MVSVHIQQIFFSSGSVKIQCGCIKKRISVKQSNYPYNVLYKGNLFPLEKIKWQAQTSKKRLRQET